MGHILTKLSVFLLLLVITTPNATAFSEPEKDLQQVGIDSHLGQKVTLDLPFTDSNGQGVTLRSLMLKNRPLVVVPAYYHCPRLCGLLLDGVVTLLNQLDLELGKDFNIVAVSFDETDNVDTAKYREEAIKEKLDYKINKQAWHFLFGTIDNSSQLMRELGFKYKRDGDDFAHTAAIFFITPNGEVSQYFTGVNFDPKTTRMALVEASQGEIGTPFDHVFLFCFRYDHLQGKYIWVAFSFMRVGGLLTLSFLGYLIYRLWRRERRGANGQVAAS